MKGLSLSTSYAHLRPQDGGNKEIVNDRIMESLQLQHHGQAWSHPQVQRQMATVTEAPTCSLYMPPVQIPRHSKLFVFNIKKYSEGL